MTRLRVASLACVLALACGCAPKMINTFIPGEQPPAAVRIPRGTRMLTPDGKEYLLGDDGIVLSVGHWCWVLNTLDKLARAVPERNRWNDGL